MGSEQPAEFYDRHYVAGGRYDVDVADSPWANVHYWALSRVGGETVIDLGCGVGHFAELLARRGHDPSRYLGVDFSQVAIDQARARVSGFQFVVADIRAEARRIRTYQGSTVVLCEVLEHVEHDLTVLRALPPGTRVIGTVPDHDSEGHVRHFENMAIVARRYEHALYLQSITRIGRCFGFEGIRPTPEAAA